MTNILGPSAPIRLGNEALSKSIMFLNYYPMHYIQFYVFSHCDELKLGYGVSQMDIDGDRLMAVTEEAIN